MRVPSAIPKEKLVRKCTAGCHRNTPMTAIHTSLPVPKSGLNSSSAEAAAVSGKTQSPGNAGVGAIRRLGFTPGIRSPSWMRRCFSRPPHPNFVTGTAIPIDGDDSIMG